MDASRRLDGNAAAGLLREIFCWEMTSAAVTCGNCGATNAVGALIIYASPMGTVLRCPACEQPLVRVVRTSNDYWLDISGARCIQVTPDTAAT
ncbi:MAG: DUF6510 family protein [Chloroflexaceae bacterium]|jgi:hypothetical protein|nr:DUF6510 family protein [Chloroflexaceae bacterium]